MRFEFSKTRGPSKASKIFFVTTGLKFPLTLKSHFNEQKQITQLLAAHQTFKGKLGQYISFVDTESGMLNFVFGIGEHKKLDSVLTMNLGGKICDALNAYKIKRVEFFFEDIEGKKWTNDNAAKILLGVKLKNYRFNKYFIDKKEENRSYVENVIVVSSLYKTMQPIFSEYSKLADGIFLTRDLVSEPPNVLYPETFALRCQQLSELGIKVKVLEEPEMRKLGMNALLGVAQGSIRAPKLVIMEWYGHPKGRKESPIAFIGKGVTFDSGGINIKPSTNMGDMKYDMAGAGVVTGLMHALAGRKAAVNAIGVVGLVENMPSGSAQRPSDVVLSASGQSIEIDNTDAEGRLVLADALWYTETHYKPEYMIDLATLTGAIVVALGDGHAGLFSNNEKLTKMLVEASRESGELLWPMPMADHYDKQINSEIADVRNTGTGGGGGSITAAQFLKRFVKTSKWAHIDIAGMAWHKKGTDIIPKGATGYGVRLLNTFIKENFEG